jgi:hypothetical protein
MDNYMADKIPEFLRDEWLHIDIECRSLVSAINFLPGIKTIESCCGHGNTPFHIWFEVTDYNARGLITLARCTSPRYNSYAKNEFRLDPLWQIQLDHGDINPIGYLLKSVTMTPENAKKFQYDEVPGIDSTKLFLPAEKLAYKLRSMVEDTCEGYNILYQK